MALEVEERPAGDVADHLDLVRPEPDAAGLEAVEVVEVARRRGSPSRRPTAIVGRERRLDGRRARPSGSSRATRRTARPARGRPPGRRRRAGRRGRGSRASPRAAARPSSSSTSSIQRPAIAPRSWSGIRATAVIHVGSTRSIVRLVSVVGPVELEPGVDEVASVRRAPVTVLAASAKRSSQVGSRPPPSARWAANRRGSSSAGEVVEADHQQDLAGVARDEVHQLARHPDRLLAAVAGVAQERRQLGRGAGDAEPGRLERRDLGRRRARRRPR